MCDEKSEMRLLLVEDETLVRKTIYELLIHDKRINSIMEASTLIESFTILENFPIDVIILDLRLPDSDGADTVEAITARFPEIPVIVITGLDLNRKFIDSLIIAGSFAFMSKSFLLSPPLMSHIEKAFLYKKCINMTRGKLLNG